MKTKIFIISFTFFSFTSLIAQDILIKKNGEKINVIIKEVTEKTIKYVDFKDPRGVVFSIDKVLVAEVKFEYGKNISVQDPEKNELYYVDDKITNIMFSFLAFGSNTFALAYEKVLEPGSSIMIEGKVYGLGIQSDNETSRNGFGLAVSYRLKTKSLFNSNEYRPKHLLHGNYFEPIIGFSTGKHTYDTWLFSEKVSTDHSLFYFGINYGKQYVFQRKITIDTSIGLAYYFGNQSSTDEYASTLRLGNMIGDDDILLSFHLRIGFLTGKKRLKKK